MTKITLDLNKFDKNGNTKGDSLNPVDVSKSHITDIVDHATQLILMLRTQDSSPLNDEQRLVAHELEEALENAEIIDIADEEI